MTRTPPSSWLITTHTANQRGHLHNAKPRYAASVESLLEGLRSRGQGVAAFFAEPYFVSGGVHPPAPQYFTRCAF